MDLIFQKILSLDNWGFFFRITCKDNWILDSGIIKWDEEQGYADKDEVVEFCIPMITPLPDDGPEITNTQMAHILVSQASQFMLASELLLTLDEENVWVEQFEAQGQLIEYVVCITYSALVNHPAMQVLPENTGLS